MNEKSLFDSIGDDAPKPKQKQQEEEETYTGKYKCLLIPYGKADGGQQLLTLDIIPRSGDHLLLQRGVCNVEYMIKTVIVNGIDQKYDVALHIVHIRSY